MQNNRFRAYQKKQPHQEVAPGYVYSRNYDSLSLFFKDNEDEDIEQSTGLRDSRDQEIYEGDIIEVNNEYWGNGRAVICDGGYTFYVTQVTGKSLLFYDSDGEHWQPLESEVIGNIHENSALLNGVIV